MKDAATGHEVARLGDTTDHGGIVIEAAPNLRHKGIRVALDGHMVDCPKCGGRFPIKAEGTRTHNGARVAFLGNKTACGATLMSAGEGA
ncbi:PAAR domain-containing protein [Paraburkholderia unamae]|uniref:Zn-binding protein involved in type VI secretion n=1 Tax=Paraburkholderia unamae TaxID=219649 RepID=A0ABX5K975_9BURK|nr:PAAR domain-containing protein [Paraburkholderia unamae]PVX71060.1 putative Zn-binding protein involved in type VI secretion [Paraburkholderia unamae]CAG9247019.1 Putative Zn-binding protein involved in type VI secretion [Paraburkholderia unamae]